MKIRRWLRRLATSVLALAILLPLLAYGLSNLYLVSPKGRDKIASQIKLRIGLENTVQGATWSPWNGITLYGLRVEQPGPLKKAIRTPLLLVESVRVDPLWGALLRKELLVKKIDILKPELTLPIELLSQLPDPAPDPRIATKLPQLSAVDPGKQAIQQAPPPLTGSPAPVAPAPPETAVVPAPDQPPVIIEAVPESQEPNVWVNFSGAKLKIVSTLTKHPLYEISRIDGGLPMGGKPMDAKLETGRISALGNKLAESLTIPVKWKAPLLEFGTIGCGLSGIECELSGFFGLTQEIPFQINAVLPKQRDRKLRLGEQLHATLGSIAGKGRFQGYLQAPGTWQGQGVVQALSVKGGYGEQEARFDRGQSIILFRNGALSCLDARLIGESISILGNGTLLKDGRGAANARIVAPPETLVAISKYTEPGSAAPSLTPLSTPQRSALDLQVFGRLGEFFYKSNPKADAVPLR